VIVLALFFLGVGFKANNPLVGIISCVTTLIMGFSLLYKRLVDNLWRYQSLRQMNYDPEIAASSFYNEIVGATHHPESWPFYQLAPSTNQRKGLTIREQNEIYSERVKNLRAAWISFFSGMEQFIVKNNLLGSNISFNDIELTFKYVRTQIEEKRRWFARTATKLIVLVSRAAQRNDAEDKQEIAQCYFHNFAIAIKGEWKLLCGDPGKILNYDYLKELSLELPSELLFNKDSTLPLAFK
jgi:hypothetical protein